MRTEKEILERIKRHCDSFEPVIGFESEKDREESVRGNVREIKLLLWVLGSTGERE